MLTILFVVVALIVLVALFPTLRKFHRKMSEYEKEVDQMDIYDRWP